MPRAAFTSIWAWDYAGRRLERQPGGRYTGSKPEHGRGAPVAVSTPCGSHAMAVYCAEWPDVAPRFPFGPWYTVDAETQGGHDLTGAPVALTKWNVVWHAGCVHADAGTHIPGGQYGFRFLCPVGSLADCEAALAALVPP
jgi:hypothetical protein